MKNIFVAIAVFIATISVFHDKTEKNGEKNGKERNLIDRKRLEAQLERDEGEKLVVYRDSRGILTVGIGHRVTAKDRIHVGDSISEERCREIFKQDVDASITFCGMQFKSIYQYQPYSVQELLVNMCFNLGPGGLAKFPHFLHALAGKDYRLAAGELQKSFWYTQVKGRAKRIKTAIQNEKNAPKIEIVMNNL
jgi:GH24 family phage-related lysozyme (muramidase)